MGTRLLPRTLPELFSYSRWRTTSSAACGAADLEAEDALPPAREPG